MGQVGVEPTSAVLQTAALPVERPTRILCRRAPDPPAGGDDSEWMPEGIEPSSPGCKPGVFPLDDGPVVIQRCGKGSNLQPRPSEGRALVRLSYHSFFASPQETRLVAYGFRARLVGGALRSGSIVHLMDTVHPAGFEPASVRVRTGGSAVELQVHIHQKQPNRSTMHREGLEPSSSGFVGRRSSD